MALPSAAWPALLLLFLAPVALGRARIAVLQFNTSSTSNAQNASIPEPAQPGNSTSSIAFPSCATDAGCPGALVCVEGTCGCPIDRPVLVLGAGGRDRLSALCEPQRGLAEKCVWAEQCAATDPGLDCKRGSCQCVGRPSPWGVCGGRAATKPLIWAACFAVIALIVAGFMFCLAQKTGRHKPTCFSESCLLSAPGGSVLHNPAAQRLLFSRRKSSSGGDSRGLGGCPARCSTPSVAGSHVIGRGPMSSSAAGRAAPPLPRCFLSCNRLQQSLDDPRGDLGRSSCSLAADGAALCWPPVTILDRSEPSLELQVISLNALSAPAASVHTGRRCSAPALVVSPGRSPVDASLPAASSPHTHSEGGEPATMARSVTQDWASKLGEQLANDSCGFNLDTSQSSLPGLLSTASGAVDSDRASRQSRLRRNISESLRRELADSWRCSGTLPSSRLLLQPPAFLVPEHLGSAPPSLGSDWAPVAVRLMSANEAQTGERTLRR
ncbi:uncharacterized protein LOC144097450 [Amblyomma americanum]